jgi:hypothetical protein
MVEALLILFSVVLAATFIIWLWEDDAETWPRGPDRCGQCGRRIDDSDVAGIRIECGGRNRRVKR